MLGLASLVLTFSLISAILIDFGRERIALYTRRAENSARLVILYERRAESAEKIAEEAELQGDTRKALRYFDDAAGRAKLAAYHRDLARIYLTHGIRFWEPPPVEPLPPIVRIIPDRFPGMGRGPRLGEQGSMFDRVYESTR